LALIRLIQQLAIVVINSLFNFLTCGFKKRVVIVVDSI